MPSGTILSHGGDVIIVTDDELETAVQQESNVPLLLFGETNEPVSVAKTKFGSVTKFPILLEHRNFPHGVRAVVEVSVEGIEDGWGLHWRVVAPDLPTSKLPKRGR